MKVFTCTSFQGVWPVGCSAVVVASTKAKAKVVLLEVLKESGLADGGSSNANLDYEMSEVNTMKTGATILNDGDY